MSQRRRYPQQRPAVPHHPLCVPIPGGAGFPVLHCPFLYRDLLNRAGVCLIQLAGIYTPDTVDIDPVRNLIANLFVRLLA